MRDGTPASERQSTVCSARDRRRLSGGDRFLVATPQALDFLQKPSSRLEDRRQELLDARKRRQADLNDGVLPGFLPETREIRESEWTVGVVPHDPLNRRVETTGPVDRKMIVNALNSGASVFMADFEDADSPTWENWVQGQANLIDAVAGTITCTNPDGNV